jgi:hypothetical protein
MREMELLASCQVGAQQCCARTRGKEPAGSQGYHEKKAGKAWGLSRFSVVVVFFST